MRYKNRNDIQAAMTWLDAADTHEPRAISLRSNGDGEYLIKYFLNSKVVKEVKVLGKRDWTGMVNELGDIHGD